MNDFYGAVASACFTLLGLWWVVIELNHEQWLADPPLRRMAYRTMLFFLLPGLMSVLSMLEVEGSLWWRSVFVVSALVGVVECAATYRASRRWPQVPEPTLVTVAAFVLYLVIALIAAVPSLLSATGVRPIAVEGVLVALLVLLGVQLAWAQFVSSNRGARETAE